MTVLVRGTNESVCVPGDENKIGDPPMCMNPMGMRWMMDAMQGKPKPTNSVPGMIYMLCDATQRSNTDPSDKTGPAIPIGPHWMITWRTLYVSITLLSFTFSVRLTGDFARRVPQKGSLSWTAANGATRADNDNPRPYGNGVERE